MWHRRLICRPPRQRPTIYLSCFAILVVVTVVRPLLYINRMSFHGDESTTSELDDAPPELQLLNTPGYISRGGRSGGGKVRNNNVASVGNNRQVVDGGDKMDNSTSASVVVEKTTTAVESTTSNSIPKTIKQQKQQQPIMTKTTTTTITPPTNTTHTPPTPTTPPPLIQCSSIQTLPPRKRPAVDLISHTHHLKLMSSPKAGATLATQLLFDHLNLTSTALSHSPWIHDYRQDVFMHDASHRLTPSREVCLPEDHHYTCLKIVRSPLDRAISSYIHTMLMIRDDKRTKMTELSLAAHTAGRNLHTASFSDFVVALSTRAKTKLRSLAESHFMPQWDEDNEGLYNVNGSLNDGKEGGGGGGVWLVPVEALGSVLDVVRDGRGVFLNATGLTSDHYVTEEEEDDAAGVGSRNVAHVPWPDVMTFVEPPPRPPSSPLSPSSDNDDERRILPSHATRRAPSYDSYLRDANVNAMLCRVYCNDFELYATACRARWLRDVAAVREVCERERRRVREVCGMGYDFFGRMVDDEERRG